MQHMFKINFKYNLLNLVRAGQYRAGIVLFRPPEGQKDDDDDDDKKIK